MYNGVGFVVVDCGLDCEYIVDVGLYEGVIG